MKKHRFTVLIERDEDGYLVATVPALKLLYPGKNHGGAAAPD